MPAHHATQLDEDRLTEQIRAGHRRLRFQPMLEQAFRADFFRRGLPYRKAVLALAAVLIAITPLYDVALLQAPAAFNAQARVLQFGVMIPVLLLATFVNVYPRTQRFADAVTVLASLIVALGMLAQHVLGARHGFDMPVEFVGITISASFLLARLRFRMYLPVALGLLFTTLLAETWLVRPAAAAWYHVSANSMLILLSAVAAYSMEYVIRTAWLNELRLQIWSVKDSLTGLLNRRAFNHAAESRLRQAAREGAGIGLAMLDLDQFKRFNDHYGHPTGDECLRHVAAIVEAQAQRPLDCSARYGGEEFIALWYGVDRSDVETIANAISLALERDGMPHAASSVSDKVTLSAGVIVCHPDAQTRLDTLIRQADNALYAAKAGGRNRWIFADADPQDRAEQHAEQARETP